MMILSLPVILHGNRTLALENKIRVAVLKDVPNFVISARGVYEIIDPQMNLLYKHSRRLKRSRVNNVDGKISIGAKLYPLHRLRVYSHKDITIYANKKERRYRGIIDIRIDKDGNFLVTNILDVESYVRGVLYHEISDEWPMEAMKAQAVATRTYAHYQMEQAQQNLFDVTSDIYSQVYGGRSAERFRTNLAASKTKGEVLIYQGGVIPAFFHSNSGGHTEDANQVWGIDLPPLKGVISPYSQDAPSYQWHQNFQSSVVQAKLNENGYHLDLIKDIRIAEKNPSGRIKELLIETRDGQVTRISGKKFRDILGPNVVKSNLYDIQMKGYFFDLSGRGWGHGVGMCQWGAHEMAQRRFQYRKILDYYYPGTNILQL